MIYDVAVLGGGASGLLCAAKCAEGGLETVLIDKYDKVGKKLLVTGNGRCNLTNMDMGISHYYGSNTALAGPVIRRYDAKAIVACFNAMGLYTRSKDGLVYPLSNKASSVVDVMRNALQSYGATVVAGFEISSVAKDKGGFITFSPDGQKICSKRLVVATGLKAYNGTDTGIRILESFGHRINPLFPGLVQLKSDAPFIKGLKGVKFNGAITAFSDKQALSREIGEILFTDYGISGIAVMQLSRFFSQYGRLSLEMDFLPEFQQEQLESILFHLRHLFIETEIPAEELLTGLVDKKLGRRIIKVSAALDPAMPAGKLRDKNIRNIAKSLKSTRISITGHNGFKNAQTCGGGASLTDFNMETLESRYTGGLYATGEVLDIAGDCGGYNLHWAWATALQAANAIIRSFK